MEPIEVVARTLCRQRGALDPETKCAGGYRKLPDKTILFDGTDEQGNWVFAWRTYAQEAAEIVNALSQNGHIKT